MGDSSDIVVEVIVWEGITVNPFGHISTKITKNGITYSYSLEHGYKPRLVCNKESFRQLDKHEQRIRSGNGLILNVTEDQAKEIFIVMQTRFHDYKGSGCDYLTFWHNCTSAIQRALKKSGVNLYDFVFHSTILPAYVERNILKTKNNGGWLVKEIIKYKKGEDKGVVVNKDEDVLLFGVNVQRTKEGWYTDATLDIHIMQG